MIKRFHEAPISIFERVQGLTDGDYALVHLLEENPEYRDMFLKAKRMGREIILDNSVFELGPKFDVDLFADWVRELQPTYYIVPDVPEDYEAHITKFQNFISKYSDLPGMRMGVVQGESMSKIIKCYEEIEPYCDKIAISMDYRIWHKIFEDFEDMSPEMRLVQGRRELLALMQQLKVVNPDKPHHLLGVQLPQEVLGYAKKYPWIDSIDTSNPVVHGMLGIEYDHLHGLPYKRPEKLADYIDWEVTPEQWDTIQCNIRRFRRMCSYE